MKTRTWVLAAAVLTLLVAQTVRADWNVGDPYKMHYPQLPDMSPTGLDVLATIPTYVPGVPIQGKILADDWRCTATGPVTDIHIWGSWLNDLFPINPARPEPNRDPGHVRFNLSIHSDIPATPISHSRPGELLWFKTFNPLEFRTRMYGTAQEHFLDPNTGQYLGFDTHVLQYNFLIPATEAFVQERGKIYWLDVQAVLIDPAQPAATQFGWKTSLDHFNDDAVFADNDPSLIGTGNLLWRELRYPSQHPFAGDSIDLAFVITPEPISIALLAVGAPALVRRRR